MNSYRRLTLKEREDLGILCSHNISIRKISQRLMRAPSTISREIKRNCAHIKYYRASCAQGRWNVQRNKRKKRKLDKNPILRQNIIELLEKNWSPEQIANRLKYLYPSDMNMHLAHETIYSYLYVKPKGALQKKLIPHLRRAHAFRRKNGRKRIRKSPIQDYISIDVRPEEIENRQIPGHWEGDLIVGKRNISAVGTLVERKTRLLLIVPLLNHMATVVREAFEKQFEQLPQELKKSLTYDQGGEMVQHKLFTENTKITVYFAHVKSPWERGTNENTNSLIRQYFPSGTDFRKIKPEQLKFVQDEINDRPRKTLNWATPHEAFSQLLH